MEKIDLSLSSISLEAKNEGIDRLIEKVLVENLLLTRKVNRGIVANIIIGAWQTKQKVKVQSLQRISSILPLSN